MPIVKIITLLFLKVKADHHTRKEKRISAGAILSAVPVCADAFLLPKWLQVTVRVLNSCEAAIL